MEPEIIAIAGIIVIILFVGIFLYIPDALQDFGQRAKTFYETYVDWIIVAAAGFIALLLTTTALGFYIAGGDPRDAYIAAAVFIYLVKMALTLIDTLVGQNKFLLATMSHLMDLAILGLLCLGIAKR